MKTLKLKERTLKSFNNKMRLMDYREPFDGMLSPDVYELTYTNMFNTNHVVSIRYDENDNVLSVLFFTEATPLGMELYWNNQTWKHILMVIGTFQSLAS